MKVIIEIEAQDDMQKVAHFLKSLQTVTIQVDYLHKQQQVQRFFDYLNRATVAVKKIEIPDREIRNAR